MSVHGVTALLTVAAIWISERTVLKGDCQMRTASTALVVIAADSDSSTTRVTMSGKTSCNWAPATVLVPRPRMRGGSPPQHVDIRTQLYYWACDVCCRMELRITWFESRSSERLVWYTFSTSFMWYTFSTSFSLINGCRFVVNTSDCWRTSQDL